MAHHSKPMGVKEYTDRLAICKACPKMAKKLTGSYCQLCGCIIKLKARKENEKCPLGKW